MGGHLKHLGARIAVRTARHRRDMMSWLLGHRARGGSGHAERRRRAAAQRGERTGNARPVHQADHTVHAVAVSYTHLRAHETSAHL
eukprot:9587347-Alexandrium_andersonii.AAC.1